MHKTKFYKIHTPHNQKICVKSSNLDQQYSTITVRVKLLNALNKNPIVWKKKYKSDTVPSERRIDCAGPYGQAAGVGLEALSLYKRMQ